MKNIIISSLATSLLLVGCGASHPPPTQQMADTQAATRSATELGAQKEPSAQLHLKLAEEQMGLAKNAMKKEDNELAGRLLVRAKADAELAVALMREDAAKHTAVAAANQLASQQSTNENQGATP